MTDGEKPSHRIPFPALRGGHAFDKALKASLNDAVDERLSVFFSPENSHTLYHGLGWTFQRKDDVAARGEIERHQAAVTIETRDVVEHDLSAIPRFTRSLTEEIGGQAEREIYGMVMATSESVGNVVNREPGMLVIDTVLAVGSLNSVTFFL